MLKRLFPYFKGYKRQAILAPVLIALETICELILPLLMAEIIDSGIQKGDMPVILKMGALMLVVAAAAMYFGVMSSKHAAFAAQGLGANLRKAQFDKISTFSFGNIDRFSTASLVTRLTNDVTNVQNMVAMALRLLIRSGVMIVASMAVAIYIRWQLAMILIIAVPVIALVIGLLMKVCMGLFRAMQHRLDLLNETVQENLTSIRVVKSYVREEFEKEKFKTSNDNFTKAGMNVSLRIILMQPAMMLGVSISTVLILYLGGQTVLRGDLEIGLLSSLLNYVLMVLMSVMMVAMCLLMYTRAKACAQRIFEVIDTEPDIQDGSAPALPEQAGQVEFRDVSFKYDASGTGDNVLSHISFTAKPGQVVAVIGGTGEGKSTLVNLIPRFYDATEGEVLVDGINVKDYPLEDLRHRIGMVLQNNVLFSGTIRENLLWGNPDATEEEVIQAAKDAQAYDFILSFPKGFDTWLEQGGVNVSGGQKQRLCIARAMLRKPSILILDDSTSAVDSATEALIRESFHENLKDTTVFLIAQRISSVRDADQIIILDDGEVADIGTHDQLMAESKIYQEIYHSQLKGGVYHG